MYKSIFFILIYITQCFANIDYTFFTSESLPIAIKAGKITYYTAKEVSVIAKDNIKFSNYEITQENFLEDFALTTVNSKATQIIGEALPYPNPSDPLTDNTFIGYFLNKPTDIRIQIYTIYVDKK
jgi:hypothetical protein